MKTIIKFFTFLWEAIFSLLNQNEPLSESEAKSKRSRWSGDEMKIAMYLAKYRSLNIDLSMVALHINRTEGALRRKIQRIRKKQPQYKIYSKRNEFEDKIDFYKTFENILDSNGFESDKDVVDLLIAKQTI